jgi:hypothetical protein
MTKKMGRPTLDKSDVRGKFFSTRVSDAEYIEIMAAIHVAGIKKPEWIRHALLAKARNVHEK